MCRINLDYGNYEVDQAKNVVKFSKIDWEE